MSHPTATTSSVVTKYENFINDVLKEDLRQLDAQLRKVNDEITELINEKHALQVITDPKRNQNGFKTQLNIGCNFFMEASVPDTSSFLMNIGLQHYVELTVAEAINFIDARIRAYERNGDEIAHKSFVVKAHIKMILFGIGQFQDLQNSKKNQKANTP